MSKISNLGTAPLQDKWGYEYEKGVAGRVANIRDYSALRVEAGEELVTGIPVKLDVNRQAKKIASIAEAIGVIIFTDGDLGTYTFGNGNIGTTYATGELLTVVTSGLIYAYVPVTTGLVFGDVMDYTGTAGKEVWVKATGTPQKVSKFTVDTVLDNNIVTLRIHDVKGA